MLFSEITLFGADQLVNRDAQRTRDAPKRIDPRRRFRILDQTDALRRHSGLSREAGLRPATSFPDLSNTVHDGLQCKKNRTVSAAHSICSHTPNRRAGVSFLNYRYCITTL